MPTPDLALLLPSWELALRAERKSPQTVKSYGDGVRRFLAWAADNDRPAVLDRATVAAFVADLLDGGAEPATARARHLSLRRFSAWLVDEGEADEDRLLGSKPPKLDAKVIEPLTEDELRALIKACAGPDLRDRRDEALVRFMVETGARAGETAGLLVGRRRPAGRDRHRPSWQGRQGPDRAVRAVHLPRHRPIHAAATLPPARRRHRRSGWGIGVSRSPTTGYTRRCSYRASLAGIPDFHPHKLRHTAAHRWLAAGGSEGGLMAVAGWTRPDMLMRYTQARAAERAAAEARELNLGDL